MEVVESIEGQEADESSAHGRRKTQRTIPKPATTAGGKQRDMDVDASGGASTEARYLEKAGFNVTPKSQSALGAVAHPGPAQRHPASLLQQPTGTAAESQKRNAKLAKQLKVVGLQVGDRPLTERAESAG